MLLSQDDPAVTRRCLTPQKFRLGLILLLSAWGAGSALGQTAFLNFNTPGQYTGNFSPWENVASTNGGVYAFQEGTPAGVGVSGGVSVTSSLDTSATYKTGSWDFSTNGAVLTVSTLIKADGQVSVDKVQLGFKNLSTNGLISNPGVAFETWRFIPQSATVWSAREQYFSTNGLGETILGNVTVSSGEWYKFVVSLTNTGGASGSYSAGCALYDYGTDGLTPGANLINFPVAESHVGQIDLTVPALWPAIRAFQDGGISAWDNFLVYTPGSAPVFTQSIPNTAGTVGIPTTFSVLVDGPGPITLAWYTNGILAAGVTGLNYTTPALDTRYTNLTVVAANSNGSTTNSAVLTVTAALGNMAAYYPLNGDVLDYSGNGQNGINYGATFITPGYTTGAEAAQFNGASTYTQVPRSIGVTGTGFTIALWVKTTQTAGTGPWYGGNGLVDGDLPGNQNDFGTSLDGTKFALGIGNPDTTVVSHTVINNGNWHHVAGTWDMNTGAMKVYVDGAFDNSGTGPTGPRSAPTTMCIGRTPQDPNYFNGAIADVRLYNSVLTTQQVTTLASLQPVSPTILTPTVSPTNVVYAGTTLMFNVLAAGPPTPGYYQWTTNGVALPGATGSTLVLSNVTVSQSGTYAALAGNSAGTNASPVIAVTINPASAPIFTLQPTPALEQAYINGSASFNAAVSGSPPIALQWRLNGTNLPGQTAASIALSGVQTSQAGPYTLVAANALGTNISQTATLTVVPPVPPPAVNVLTYQNNNLRLGANTNEVFLTPDNVSVNSFGKLFSQPVDGAIYAEPLYISGMNLPGKGTHNVVFIATQHGGVYAFDADSNSGTNATPLWQISMINPGAGVTSVTAADLGGCANIPHEQCIDDTPAIDLNSGTMYFEAFTREQVGTNVSVIHRLHAINITNGVEQPGSPVVIAATVPGNGVNGNGTNVTFNPKTQEDRTALLLQNGTVYFGYSSFCDAGSYHGWVFAYNARTLQQVGAYCDTPNGSMGGIWLGSSGLTADASNNVFSMTGNGSYNTNFTNLSSCNLGSSFLKFTGSNSLVLTDYFTPYNGASLSSADLDVAAGSAMVLPDSVGSAAHPHLLMGTGKDGTMYILDRDNLGHFNAANDSQIVQELPNAVGVPWNYPVPAFFNNTIYYQGNGTGMQAFAISNAVVTTTPISTSAAVFGAPGGVPVLSANGTSNAIAWALETVAWAGGGPSVLHAFNATNLTQELYNTSMNAARDNPGVALKWIAPCVAGGKVYVGTEFVLSVYGNGVFVATPAIAPNGGLFTNSQTVTLSDTTVGAQIYYTLDGTTPTTNSPAYTAPIILSNSASITAFAAAPGAVNSGIASATFIDTSAAGTGTGLTGQYWTNTTSTAFTNAGFNTPPTLTRVDSTINFNWTANGPAANIGKTNYTVRWTGTVQPQFNENYTFSASADDGVRVWVNGQLVIDGWVIQATTTYSNSITLKAQQYYNIQMDYFQGTGNAVAELQWASPSTPLAVIPQSQLYPGTNPPPAVAFVTPTNNASYTATASVTFEAVAAAQYNSLDHVTFYSGGSPVATLSNAPYVFTATGLGAGNYNFTVAATDGSGLSSTSTPVNISVSSGSGLNYGLTARGTAPAFYNMPGASTGPLPAHLSQTGVFTDTANLVPAPGLIPYAPNTPLWSDNAVKSRYLSVPFNGGLATPDQQINFAPTGQWSFPSGTVFVKTFSLAVDETNPNVPLHRLETRLLVRDTNGVVYGVTYKWRADNTDADLLVGSLSENIQITNTLGVHTQSWYYPSQADCLTCHTHVANYVLGLNTRQLNGNLTYANSGVTDNQLRTLNQLGLFNAAIDEASISNLSQMVSVTNAGASLENRVRSYLDANCAQCHQPTGPGPSFDARYDTPLTNQSLIGGSVIANLGVDNAHVVTPDDIWRSMLYQRADSLTPGVKMPPLARNLVDTNAMAVMAGWINGLPGIPALAPPSLVPAGGEFSGPLSVTVLPPDANAAIYYTLDGSLPTTGSFHYLGPIMLTNSATVTANAFETGYTNSVAASGLFTIIPIVFDSEPIFSGGVLQFELSGATNESYVLQASTNLVQWTSISTNTPASAPFFFTDPHATNFIKRYYRVLLQP